MYIPYSFMWQGTRYITLVGAVVDDYLELTEVVNYKNAMPWAILNKGNIKPQPNLENQAGSKFMSVPIVEAEAFERTEDGFYRISGKLNGKEVVLTDTALIVDGQVICGVADGETVHEEVPVETVEEEKKEEVVEQEPESEPAPEPEAEKTEEEVAAVPKEPESAPLVEKQSAFAHCGEDYYGVTVGSTVRVSDKPFEIGAAVVNEDLAIGVELYTGRGVSAPHVRRRNFDSAVQPAHAKKRYPWQRTEDIDERQMIKPEEPVVPSGLPTVAPEVVEKPKEVEKAWAPPIGQQEQWAKTEALAPVSGESAYITPEEPVQAAPDVNKELKEAFRSTLSEEINKVIGDIPHSILGNIETFTTNDIDHTLLKEQGELYCIDHRWQKCGKWFCIDIVNHYSRYFYNAKLGISIEIPVATCKDWLNIVTGGGTN